jgi:hypothetical protein
MAAELDETVEAVTNSGPRPDAALAFAKLSRDD